MLRLECRGAGKSLPVFGASDLHSFDEGRILVSMLQKLFPSSLTPGKTSWCFRLSVLMCEFNIGRSDCCLQKLGRLHTVIKQAVITEDYFFKAHKHETKLK